MTHDEEMDGFENVHEPNRDEQKARHIAELAFEFMNANHPIPTDVIWHNYYPDTKRDSFGRAFLRDREDLTRCGLVLEECQAADGTSCWGVDERASFAGQTSLSQEDVFVLDATCAPLLTDPSFPYADDLRMALAKIDRSFVGFPPMAVPTGEVVSSPALATVEAAFDGRYACEITYRDASGRESTRNICTFGLYGLRNAVYVVAALLEDDGPCDPATIRNYNAGRIIRIRAIKTARYEIPEDFDIEEHVYLPFQLGPTQFGATFRIPREREADARRDARGHGSFHRTEEGLIWKVDVFDPNAAASWAIVEGVVPLEPSEVCACWRDLLEGVLEHD